MTVDDLREAVMLDIDASRTTFANVLDLQKRTGDSHPDVHTLAAFGAYLRDAYQGMENILGRLLKFYSVPLPDTADWHLILLRMFCDPPQAGLPLLFPAELRDRITPYRGFRHVFNKRYAAHLDWEKLQPLVEQLERTFSEFHARVLALLDLLAKPEQ